MRNDIFIYSLVILIWAITVVLKLKYNGLVLGFDYGLYHPDGALYATRALDWSGFTENEAAKLVFEWYEIHAYKFNFNSPSDLYYTNHHLYPEYSTRILYPLLSVPFIKLFGFSGLLFVPALSLLIMMLVITKIGKELKKPFTALVVIILLSSSTTVTRWMLVNTTDSLLAGLFCFVALLLLMKNSDTLWIWATGFLIFLTALTRISVLFWLAIALVQFAKNRKQHALYVFTFSVIVTLPILFSNTNESFLPVESDKPLLERLLLYPFYFIKVVFYEFAQLLVLDKVLFLMCALSLFFSIRFFHKISSKYLISMFIAGFATGAANGTIGVNFRYQLPILVFVCWSLIDNININLKKYFKFSS